MAFVVGVKFQNSNKIYYFDPAGHELEKGQHVIVETVRGVEYGEVVMKPGRVNNEDVVHPLKEILRIATEEDDAKYEANLAKRDEALRLCQEKIDKRGLEMKLVDMEYTFDARKIIFYFTAEGRVDFRELVKDLAHVFKTRIELRQIGVRDEAKMIGGVGNCGRALCCKEWMPEFVPVSIKMAKTQNLSLNPTKISGVCGRLMCCLQFENDIYAELGKGMPNVGERVMTPDGIAMVVDSNILLNKIKCRYLIEGQNEDGEKTEELDGEIYVFDKSDIKRMNRKGKKKKGDPRNA
jgi:cell fate regulator YaaT (PSP1 superfamily)